MRLYAAIDEEAAGRIALLAQGFSHPLRVRIVAELARANGVTLSPTMLSDRLDQPLHAVGYHVRQLRNAGLVDDSHHRVRRGTIEHFYRPTPLAELTFWALDDLDLERGPRRG